MTTHTTTKTKISQSLIKAFTQAFNPFTDRCELEVYKKYIAKEPHEEKRGDALLQGLLFEQVLIGSTRDADNVFDMIPRVGQKSKKPSKSSTKAVKVDYLKSKGKPTIDMSAAELQEIIDAMPEDMSDGELPTKFKAVRELARKHKGDLVTGENSIFDQLGVIIDQVQPELEADVDGFSFIMHPDLGALVNKKLAWIDIKYTDTKESDRFHGWGDLEAMDHTQAKFYTWLWHKMTGDWIQFFYLVFGKDGWVKWIEVKFDDATMAAFELEVMDVAKAVENWIPKPIGRFNTCQKCPFFDKCDKAQRVPEVTKLYL